MTALAGDPRVVTAARVGEALPAEGGLTMLRDPDPFNWSLRVAMQRVVAKDHEKAVKASRSARAASVRSRRRRK